MIPRKAEADSDWAAILGLIQRNFAYMDVRIDPPSSMHRLSESDIAAATRSGEVWLIGTPPIACMFIEPKPHALYIGKVAVDAAQRGKGLSRRLMTVAEKRAHALGLPALELQVRVELVENHAIYTRMGFVKTAETSHPGYSRPTSYTFQKLLCAH